MSTALPRTRMLWLDLTRSCQLRCGHCYNDSGPEGGHGTMSRKDWLGVLEQAAGYGILHVQFIGGEPMMHPDFTALVGYALDLGLEVEVYSNLVHVPARFWELFRHARLSVATSYYSHRPDEHDAMTGRRSHRRTRANIERAVRLGIPLRVGVIGDDAERTQAARQDLRALGVTRIGTDHVRPFGRGSAGRSPDASALCGDCGNGKAAIGPDGKLSPCVFSGFMDVGNVKTAALADILGGVAMAAAGTAIRGAVRSASSCYPDAAPCRPDDAPPHACSPDDQECTPGYPGSECSPRS